MKMHNIIIVLVKTVTNVEEKTANALIFKKKKSANVYCNDCGQSFQRAKLFYRSQEKTMSFIQKVSGVL